MTIAGQSFDNQGDLTGTYSWFAIAADPQNPSDSFTVPMPKGTAALLTVQLTAR
jgi:hypothetical protein